MLNKFINILENKEEIYLRIKVRSGASASETKEILEDDTIKIDIAAPAVKGKANQELIRFLAKNFCIHKKDVRILSGAGSKIKLIKISI